MAAPFLFLRPRDQDYSDRSYRHLSLGELILFTMLSAYSVTHSELLRPPV
jgi:hypothetical protein